MYGSATQPVFVFLPVADRAQDGDGVVDPVCGRRLAAAMIAGRLLHGGVHHYFCSLACAERFAGDPAEFDLR